MYIEDQPDFVNAAAAGDTELPPRELLAQIQAIEAAFGRDRGRERPKGERSLDIDILLYGSSVIDEPDLKVPHAALKERLFALLPLLDLDPVLRDPLGGEEYSDIARKLPDQGIYLLG
jgi:2-amino-4-hydroxy-6-hydroxymethyldihydropteridine diphosphokinase